MAKFLSRLFGKRRTSGPTLDHLDARVVAALDEDIIDDPEVIKVLMSGPLYFDGAKLHRLDDDTQMVVSRDPASEGRNDVNET